MEFGDRVVIYWLWFIILIFEGILNWLVVIVVGFFICSLLICGCLE